MSSTFALSTEQSLLPRLRARLEADARDALDLAARCRASCRSLRRRPRALRAPAARLAEVDVAGQLAHDHEVEPGDDLGLERRRRGELRDRGSPAAGSRTGRAPCGCRSSALLGTQLARQRVVLRSADGAEQHRVGRSRERERRVGQRIARRVVAGAADRRGLGLERQALRAQQRRARAAPAPTISGPMPSPGRIAIFISVRQNKSGAGSPGAASIGIVARHSHGCSASRFVSNARISSACCSVRPMSSRPFSRQCLRNGSTSKPNASAPSGVDDRLPLEVDRELEARERERVVEQAIDLAPRAARSAAGRS